MVKGRKEAKIVCETDSTSKPKQRCLLIFPRDEQSRWEESNPSYYSWKDTVYAVVVLRCNIYLRFFSQMHHSLGTMYSGRSK